MIVRPMVFRSVIMRRSTNEVRFTDVFEVVGVTNVFIEKPYLCKKSLSYYFQTK
ncbi:hypothetical protein KSF_027290 [Reticulibacter mediterranei]|uniref:Uncharacterized protein n=1 Tax=Reticulibacter mediterranei TaxID=2778369 RepID=A0A8J3IE69_9CHLR|nr:hypothetical protein KSF_027290 [Reticulibacter mediterranei]